MRPSQIPTPFPLALALAAAWAAAGCDDAPAEDDDSVQPDDDTTAAPLEPGPFQAGSAEARIPAPLGIGTAGYNGIGQDPSPTPYSVTFPGTTRIHGHPRLTALALSRGPGFELVIVRADMVAVREELRQAVLAEVEARTGRELDDGLLLSATHTHSGPGRFIQGNLYELITDDFFPEYYARLVDAFADVVEAALIDLAPAELGTHVVAVPGAHSDRRCEDGVDFTDDSMPLLVVRRGGEVTDVALSYALHGTVLGMNDNNLSQDASGGIEEKVAQLFDHPVRVVLLNSWAADMAPGDPARDAEGPLSPVPDGYERMDRLGAFVADSLGGVLESMPTTTEPTVEGRTFRYPIDRASIGYGEDEFPYEWGGVYCDSAKATCDAVIDVPDLDHQCIPFPEASPGPLQSLFTVGTVGDLDFVTWGGECSTGLALRVREDLRARTGREVLFLGYGNDYMGYQVEEDDWWHGGYEASGAMWGPRQGEYMAGVLAESFAAYLAGGDVGWTEPAPPQAYDLGVFEPWQAESALDHGAVLAEPAGALAADGVASFTVAGADPWYGAPRAWLQQESSGSFLDVARANGSPVDSDSYAFWVDLDPAPGYDAAPDPQARTFAWTFSFAAGRHASGLPAPLAGTYRMRAVLPDEDGGEVEVTSAPFTAPEG